MIGDDYVRDVCYLVLSESSSDATICDKIVEKEQKDSCYGHLGENFKDLSFCDKTSDDWGKSFCINGVAFKLNDSSLCEGSNLKDECYSEFAQSWKDPTQCQQISDSYDQYWCIYSLLQHPWNSAVRNSTLPSICDKIADQDDHDKCILVLANYGIIGNNLTICEKVKGEENQEECYSLAGRHLTDSGLCSTIPVQKYVDVCNRGWVFYNSVH